MDVVSTWTIRFDRVALDELAALRPYDRTRIMAAIGTHLRHRPTAPTARRKRIVRETGEAIWQLRVSDHRVFYDVDAATKRVIVRRIRAKGRLTTEDIL